MVVALQFHHGVKLKEKLKRGRLFKPNDPPRPGPSVLVGEERERQRVTLGERKMVCAFALAPPDPHQTFHLSVPFRSVQSGLAWVW